MKIKILLILILLTPLGFYTKFYAGTLSDWVNNSLGGFLYEVFWCLVILLIIPKTKPYKIALGVFIITCILETLQLWHPPLLQYIRKTFIGRTLIGTSFVWTDFFYYFLGCSVSVIIMNLLQRDIRYINTRNPLR